MNSTIKIALRRSAVTVLTAAWIAAPVTPLAIPASAAGTHQDGHGHDESGHHHGGDGHHAMDIGQPAEAAEADRTVAIEMGEMYFDPRSISVQEGDVIRFVVANKGDLVHEFSIGTAAMHSRHAEEMMAMMDSGALEADRVNQHMMDDSGMHHDDPNSLLLEPGERGEITWRFDEEIELQVSCNVPGHREAGMLGHIHMGH